MKKSKGYKKIGTKNGLNIYEAIIEVGTNIDGKRVRVKRRHTGNTESAEIWYAKLIEEYYHKAKKVNINDMTFAEYSNLFVEKYCIPNVSKITTKGYKANIKVIVSYIGNYKLNKITPYMLDNMYHKIKKGRNGKELTSKTMLHYFDLVNLMFKQAKKWQFVEYNPNEDATRPKLQKKKRNFYNIEQVQNLFSCLDNENIKYRTIIILTLVSGVRRSELCALRWNDIDFINQTIYVDNSLKVIDGVVDEENAKTDFSVRTINLDNNTMKLLEEYKKWQDGYKLYMGNKWKEENRVFTDKYGGHIHPCTCNKILQKIVRKYNLPKITFHELRHTCATLLNSQGVDPVTIKERLGHSNINITLDIYTHALEQNKKDSVKVFSQLQNNIKNNL